MAQLQPTKASFKYKGVASVREGFGHLRKLLLPVVVSGIAFAIGGCGIWPVAHSTVSVGEADIQVEHVASKTITATKGGKLSVSEDESLTLAGLELEIPPGALSTDKRITIGKVVGGEIPDMHEGYHPLGYRFVLQPSNLSLEKPASLRFTTRDNTKLYNDFRAMKYNEERQQWISYRTDLDSGVLTAKIEGFSLWEWIRFWKPSNPATQAKIMDRARQWLPSITDSKLRTLLTKEFTTGITYEDAIRSLLLNEAMWKKISDGNYYDAVNLVEVTLSELRDFAGEELVTRVAGLPSVSLAAQIAALTIEVSLKTFFKQIGISLANAQVRAYLSWRGWFFRDNSWQFLEKYEHDHESVLNDGVTIQRTPEGWLSTKQAPIGNRGNPVDVPFPYAKDKDPETLFNVGKMLATFLREVVLQNGLSENRDILEKQFQQLVHSEHTLNIDGTGSGDGTVTNHSINCSIKAGNTSGDCSKSFDNDIEISLSATPHNNSSFEGWSGDCSGDDTQISIVVDSDKICIATFVRDNSLPTADISAPSDGSSFSVNETISFDGSNSSDSDGSIVEWTWNFGDGTTANGATVDHSYSSAGTYTVELTVEDDDGATASESISVNVEDFIGSPTTHVWPTYKQNMQRTNRSATAGPQDAPSTMWTFRGPTTRINVKAIVVGNNGTVYARSPSKLYAIARNGALKWSKSSPQPYNQHYSSPALGPNGRVFVIASSSDSATDLLLAFDRQGNQLWRFDKINSRSSGTEIGVSQEGDLYIITDCWDSATGEYHPSLLSISAHNGSIQWIYDVTMSQRLSSSQCPTFPDQTTPDSLHNVTAVASDGFGNLYFGIDEDLISLSSNGTKRWQRSFNDEAKGLAIAEDDTIYTVYGNTLYSIDPNAPQQNNWMSESSNDLLGNSLTIGPGEQIYLSYRFWRFFGFDTDFKAYDTQGNFLWHGEPGGARAVGKNGTLYLSAADIIAMRPDGTEKWRVDTECSNQLAIGTNGTIYQAGNHAVCALKE